MKMRNFEVNLDTTSSDTRVTKRHIPRCDARLLMVVNSERYQFMPQIKEEYFLQGVNKDFCRKKNKEKNQKHLL